MNNKIVQKVIHLVLEAIYKPWFFKQSFVFYPGFEPHNLLKYIELKFLWVDWIIEGTYSTINHIQFCNILNKNIQDSKFVNLIRKLLQCGILGQYQSTKFKFEISQKSIVSPILINIYFNELDNWVEDKINMLIQLHTNQYSKNYNQLSFQMNKKIGQTQILDKKSKQYQVIRKKLKLLTKEEININNFLREQVQIEYIRYTNDWIIGIKGNQFLTKELKIEINHFLMIHLKQTIYSIKIKIINSHYSNLQFMGYQIHFLKNRKICSLSMRIKFDVPIDFVLQRMERKGYIRKLIRCYRSISQINHTLLEDVVILKHFAQIWRGLLNYYSECNNFSKFQYIYYSLYLSFLMTLSHKHRSNTKVMLVKYGKTLTIFKDHITINFPYQS